MRVATKFSGGTFEGRYAAFAVFNGEAARVGYAMSSRPSTNGYPRKANAL